MARVTERVPYDGLSGNPAQAQQGQLNINYGGGDPCGTTFFYDPSKDAEEILRKIKVEVLPPESSFDTSDEMRAMIYDRLVEILYPPGEQHGTQSERIQKT